MIGSDCEKCGEDMGRGFLIKKEGEGNKVVCPSCKEQLEKDGWIVEANVRC